MLWIAGAQAVQTRTSSSSRGTRLPGATGVGTGSDPQNPQSLLGGEDWDAVYNGTDSAEATAFVTDSTILTPRRSRVG